MAFYLRFDRADLSEFGFTIFPDQVLVFDTETSFLIDVPLSALGNEVGPTATL